MCSAEDNMKSVFVLFVIAAVVYGRKGFGPGEQDWGYVEVRPGAHMFWWLYFTTADVTKYTERPLVLWIQGGPGGSGTGYGNFEELGPLQTNLQARNSTWVKNVNVMFIDNPVGTGYSYVENSSLFAKDNAQIAKDLVTMIKSFLSDHPEFQDVAMYMTSESYGGKMVADFALLLTQEIDNGNIKCNLRGISLGDSWISPKDSILHYAPYLRNLGFIDQDGFEQIDKAAQLVGQAIDEKQYILAAELFNEATFAIMDLTGGVDFYDVFKKIPANSITKNLRVSPRMRFLQASDLETLMNTKVKEVLGIPKSVYWLQENQDVYNALNGDFMKPVVNVVETILNSTDIKVFVLSGQKDLIVDTPGTVTWVEGMTWNGVELWKEIKRKTIVANGIIEGYIKNTNRLGMVWVDRSGHMIPSDNPNAMVEILRIFTDNYSPV